MSPSTLLLQPSPPWTADGHGTGTAGNSLPKLSSQVTTTCLCPKQLLDDGELARALNAATPQV